MEPDLALYTLYVKLTLKAFQIVQLIAYKVCLLVSESDLYADTSEIQYCENTKQSFH